MCGEFKVEDIIEDFMVEQALDMYVFAKKDADRTDHRTKKEHKSAKGFADLCRYNLGRTIELVAIEKYIFDRIERVGRLKAV